MLTDEQQELLKKLAYVSKYASTHQERLHAREDMAEIIDPAHWHRGNYFKNPRVIVGDPFEAPTPSPFDNPKPTHLHSVS